MKKITFCFGLFLSLSLSAQAIDSQTSLIDEVNQMDNVQQLIKLAEEAGKNDSYTRQEVILKRLVELRPYNPDFKFALVKAYAQQDKKSEAYNDLIMMQKAGLSYPLDGLEGFEKIKTTKVYDYIEEGMTENGKPFGAGKKYFEVDDAYSGMLFENMALDEVKNRFLLGSIRDGSVYQYTEQGGLKEFITPASSVNGPWGIIDLVTDSSADILWTASATMPHYSGTNQANFGQAMISKFKLSTGELIQNYSMAKSKAPMLFSQLHVSEGHNLYFSNVFSSDVFKIAKDSESVEPMFSLNNLKNIKAITSNSDETILYVSDFDLGIFAINLETKQTAPLMREQEGFFAGINDLFYDEGDLVAIQTGVQPARLMRYVLKQDLFLQNMFPIEASQPSFKALGNGTLAGDSVYYAANSQWSKTDPMGRLLPEQSWEALVIMKTSTQYLMEEHFEQQQRMEEIKRKRGLKK